MENAPTNRSSTATPEGSRDLSPRELAERVVSLTERDSDLRAGELPMWTRAEEPRRIHWWSLVFWIVVWCGMVPLVAAAILRLVYHDGTIWLVWLNSFTAYFYLPAYVVLALALWRRRWALAAVSGAVVACHLAWVAPDFRPATEYRATDVASPKLKIFYANVLAFNRDFQPLLNEIEAHDPDVVVFVEYNRRLMRDVLASPHMQQYLHNGEARMRPGGEVAIFTRLPGAEHNFAFAGGRLLRTLDVPVGEQSLRLIAIHNHRPLLEAPDAYAQFWKELEPIVANSRVPLVVIGDFNATQHSADLQRLMGDRLRSAHIDRGRGYATTWPNGKFPLPPIRIDHALLSPEVECLAISEGVGTGSDHLPLVVDLRVHSQAVGPGASAEP